jgi:hypothetical protein
MHLEAHGWMARWLHTRCDSLYDGTCPSLRRVASLSPLARSVSREGLLHTHLPIRSSTWVPSIEGTPGHSFLLLILLFVCFVFSLSSSTLLFIFLLSNSTVYCYETAKSERRVDRVSRILKYPFTTIPDSSSSTLTQQIIIFHFTIETHPQRNTSSIPRHRESEQERLPHSVLTPASHSFFPSRRHCHCCGSSGWLAPSHTNTQDR